MTTLAPELVLCARDAMHYLPCANAPVEAFFVLFLGANLRYLGRDMVLGNATYVFRRHTGFYVARAAELGAKQIICAHTHPYSAGSPSAQDIEMTAHFEKELRGRNLILVDHIVIGVWWQSLRAMGYIGTHEEKACA